ncbi:hypothetical protein LSH36_209g01020 [Paralvinella palmiformis]|uniref:CUB domain-containing protein n=1 Tax=Paralvinella palmiformis TaxID=53620 RepID=A0AAD9JQ61_9ANNE|nr:hypothetical protein LSH36_209g01020 [Paralvinella palmiformis]
MFHSGVIIPSFIFLLCCCSKSNGEWIEFQKPVVHLPTIDPNSCQNVWWTGLMAVVAPFDVSRPMNAACDVHVENQNVKYHHLNITLSRRRMTDKRVDGSCEDYVQIFADYTQTRPLTRRLCGDETTNVMTTDNRFLVVFFSNGARPGAGFTLSYVSLVETDEIAADQFGDVPYSGSDNVRSAFQTLIIGEYMEPFCYITSDFK